MTIQSWPGFLAYSVDTSDGDIMALLLSHFHALWMALWWYRTLWLGHK